MERKVRGDVLKSYFKYIKKTWGIVGVNDCAEYTGIDPKDLKEGNWYPIEMDTKIMTWVEEHKGEDYLERVGNGTIKDLGLLSYIVRMIDVKTVINKVPTNYNQAYNFGEVEVDIGDDEAKIYMTNCMVDHTTCKGWTGAAKGILEMTNTKGVVKKTKCQAHGDDKCVWHLEWE